MSEITEKIKQELLIRCEKSKEKDGYDFWNEHIKYVVENGIELAKIWSRYRNSGIRSIIA